MALVVVTGLSLWSINHRDAFKGVRAQDERMLIEEVSDQPARIMQSASDDAADNTIIWGDWLGSRLRRLDYRAYRT
jgi:hypothetical protein